MKAPMSALGKFVAVSSVAVGTAGAATVTWLAVSQRSPAKQVTQQGAENASADTAIVCVAPDSVLRGARDGECPAGQVKVTLSTEAEFRDFADPWNPRPSPPPRDPSDRFADLERRLSVMEKAALFEVVDKRGRLVFRVARDSASVHHSSGAPVAEIRATTGGSFFAARSADGALESFVGVSGERGGVRVREAGRAHIDLGREGRRESLADVPFRVRRTGRRSRRVEGRNGSPGCRR